MSSRHEIEVGDPVEIHRDGIGLVHPEQVPVGVGIVAQGADRHPQEPARGRSRRISAGRERGGSRQQQ